MKETLRGRITVMSLNELMTNQLRNKVEAGGDAGWEVAKAPPPPNPFYSRLHGGYLKTT
jgi:hypothetical protein